MLPSKQLVCDFSGKNGFSRLTEISPTLPSQTRYMVRDSVLLDCSHALQKLLGAESYSPTLYLKLIQRHGLDEDVWHCDEHSLVHCLRSLVIWRLVMETSQKLCSIKERQRMIQ